LEKVGKTTSVDEVMDEVWEDKSFMIVPVAD
jgi:hypothetical protein